MAITYSNFLTQIRNYTEVSSNVLSDTILDQFIRNTELNIAGAVDYGDLRKYATSVFTASNRYVSLPADCMVIRSAQVIDGVSRSFLDKRDTSFISEYNSTAKEGLPKYYANWDELNILVAPMPDKAYTVQINYIKDPPHFTSTTNTFLATNQEALLLYGVLLECFSYLKGPQDLYTLYKGRYDESISAFALQQMGRRRRDEYTDGVPRIVVPSPSPS
tara:strand:+ start:479 stop:1132 length:654 start_codon:yes stop_codon:yes gene_type:complete